MGGLRVWGEDWVMNYGIGMVLAFMRGGGVLGYGRLWSIPFRDMGTVNEPYYVCEGNTEDQRLGTFLRAFHTSNLDLPQQKYCPCFTYRLISIEAKN